MKPLNETLFRLDGDVAIVTGGARGIGQSICQLFANVGARVACLDIDEQAAVETARTIQAAGGQALGMGCDVTDEAAIRAVVDHIEAVFGPPTVLVNGAAMLDRSGTILDIDPQEWERVLRVNLGGAYLMSRAVVPSMARAGGGSIIHIASMHAHVGRAGRVSYTATKGGMLQLGKTMAVDHAAQGIRVNTLSPGAVDTQRVTFRYGGSLPDDVRQQIASKYLLQRLADPSEIAAAALFLASRASSFMTGTDLLVDGGYCAV